MIQRNSSQRIDKIINKIIDGPVVRNDLNSSNRISNHHNWIKSNSFNSKASANYPPNSKPSNKI